MEAVFLIVLAETERCAEFLLHCAELFCLVCPMWEGVRNVDSLFQHSDHIAACLCCEAAEGFDGEDRDGPNVRGIGDNLRNDEVVFFCREGWEKGEHGGSEGW